MCPVPEGQESRSLMFERCMKAVTAAASAIIAVAALSACGTSTSTATSVPPASPPAVPHAAVTRAAVAARSAVPSPGRSSRVPAASTPPSAAIKPKAPAAPSLAAPSAAAPSQAAPAPARAAVSCYPLTDGGKCYQPGEFCRAADHGAAGIDGDGNPVTCTDNDGWRWEAA